MNMNAINVEVVVRQKLLDGDSDTDHRDTQQESGTEIKRAAAAAARTAAVMNVEVVRQKLLDGDSDTVLKELVDLYRRAEILHTPQLARILDALFPVWQLLLLQNTKLPPQMRATQVNRCRKVLLQVINRLPSNDALRPYVAQLLHLLMDVLQRDNEENALIALKTLFDLHRNYRPGLRTEVQPFLDLVQQMYKNIPTTMQKQFATPPEATSTAATVNTAAAAAAGPLQTGQPSPSTTAASAATAAGTTPSNSASPVTAPVSASPMIVGTATANAAGIIQPPAAASAALPPATPAAAPTAPPPQLPSVATTAAPAAGGSATGSSDAQTAGIEPESVSMIESSEIGSQRSADEPICSSMESFKTISELPLIIMLLFQCYPNYIESYIPVLVPLMMSALALRAPDGVAKTHPTRYVDFLDCQVKTLSFVTYLLRGCASLMRPFQDAICENTVKLLIACPKDAFVLRKDIFVAARHIISTDFRRGFYAQLEVLMDDDVLVGKGRSSYYQIRPLAYSTLADMIHHVRDMLTLAQVSKIVDFYGKCIHDPTLPISIQTTSIRLLLNLVDISAKNDEVDGWRGRNVLSRILLIISTKFGTTLASLPAALATGLKHHHAPVDRSGELLEGGAMDKIKQSSMLPKDAVSRTPYEQKLDALLLSAARTHRVSDASIEEEPSLRDIKSLLRTMILGIRAVIWCTANYRNPHAKESTVDASATDAMLGQGLMPAIAAASPLSVHALELPNALRTTSETNGIGAHLYPLTDDERQLIAKVLQNGLRCFILYTLSDNTLAEEKQMLDHFAGAFTVLEAADFRDLFLANMQLLYECILQDHAILTIPQHFLANSNVSCWFAEILLKFLITQMDDLSVQAEGDLPDTDRIDKVLAIERLQFESMRCVPQVHRASIVLRLFKIVFGSVTLFKSNESALFPHLRTIIEACLKEATFTKHPDNYLLLLRALFRSISGGKYENFYKEVFPLLPGVLSALMRLQKHIAKRSMQEVLLELCLTIPARLSSLLQYLPSLMKSVVRAILSRGELAYLGLRTLEFWVDNLNPDFLYPIMTSQDRLLTEIIEALNTHLIPPPYAYGELAMRILGKIGGRNRQYLMDPLNLEYTEHYFTGVTFAFTWAALDGDASSTALPVDMDALLTRATRVLRGYMRKTEHEWVHVGKVDSRLVDVDEYDESDAAGPAFLLEKDEKTLALEAQTMDKIRASILHHKRCAFTLVSRAAVVAMELNRARGYTRSAAADSATNVAGAGTDGDAMATDASAPPPMKRIVALAAQRQIRKDLLQVLFETMVDVDLGAEAASLMEAIAVHYTMLALASCTRTSAHFAALASLQPSVLFPGTRGLSPGRHLATTTRIETLRHAAYGVPTICDDDVSNEIETFHQAILDALSSSDAAVVAQGKRALQWIVDVVVQRDASMVLATHHGGAVLNSMCDVFSHACYDKSSWRKKLGGTTGLAYLITALAPQWCHENQLTIVKALFFVLSDHPAEVSATVSAEAGDALLLAVRKAWAVKHEYAAAPLGGITPENFDSCASFQDTELLQLFVVEFMSPKAPTRQFAKDAIALFASLSASTPSTLLYPYHGLLTKQITSCNIRMLPTNTRTGYVDAMAYGLALDPPITTLTKELMFFLQEVWRLISEDAAMLGLSRSDSAPSSSSTGDASTSGSTSPGMSNSGAAASGQEYPFGLSHGCELRIAAVKLFRAAFLLAPDELNQHHEARNRFVGVFFRFLTGHPPELVACAQQALTDVIQLNKQNKDLLLPKELLQQCLRPVLLNLADYRKLNLPLLEGLSRLLTLLSSCFNVTLGEKLLEHLKQWRDPERIVKASIWKRGDEPAVAAAIVDLFHLLPPSESFLESLITCVVELEAVLPKYGSYGKMSSPYRLPLTKFLNRYAVQTVAYFLKRERLVEDKYASLFQQLVKLPEAAPLRAVLTADSGAESLVAATFVAASKLHVAPSPSAAAASAAATTPTGFGDLKTLDASDDLKMQAQIQVNAQKAAAQAVATATAQGLAPTVAEARGMQARAAYVAKAQAQVNAQQALKVQSQVQIQANAQKLHAQTLAAAQAQGLSLVQAQAKAQIASKDYIAKAQSQVSSSASVLPSALPSPVLSPLVSQQQAQQLHAQIQVNAQKVHAQALAAAQAQGLKPIQAQEKAKQAQATYVQRAKAQAQAKIARAQSQGLPSPHVNSSSSSSSSSSAASAFASKAQQEALELQYQGLRLVRSISKLHPNWLASQPAVVECLRKLWRSPARVQRLAAQDRLPIKYHLESKLLVKCLITYCRAKPDDVQVLLDLVAVFLHRTAFDFSFLQHFYRDEVAAHYAPAHKRNIVRLFLRLLREPTASEELKVLSIQLLVMPVLTASFEDPAVNNVDVMDSDTVLWMLREILASKDLPSDTIQALRIELLKLGTLLIQHMSKYVTDHRKEVIKFAWNHLKAPDLTSKLWAYVNVCRFISVYDTPPKIVLQVYVALLRTHDMDSRFLVRKAFDILLPALPTRLPSNEFIKAIKWTKKIAYEEGHILGQLVHIWFLIVRHPALFYPFRGQFVPLMVNSLNRLAIPPSSTPDNRRLAVSIVDLVIAWEQTRQERLALRLDTAAPVNELKRAHPSTVAVAAAADGAVSVAAGDDEATLKKRKVESESGAVSASASTTATASNAAVASTALQEDVAMAPATSEPARSSGAEDDFELSAAMVDLVINFAFRFALASADKQETSRLSKTCGELFDKALRLWPSAAIRFSYFDKLIAVTAEAVIRQQQQVQQMQQAQAAAAALKQTDPSTAVELATGSGGVAPGSAAPVATATGAIAAVPTPPPVMPMFFSVPKGAPLSSLAILDAVLGILNSLVADEVVTKSNRPVPYVVQYAPRIMKLLEPCFDRHNPEIQSSLASFLRRIAELYPPSRAPQQLVACKFYPWLKEIITERLLNASAFQLELNASSSSSTSSTAGSKAKAKANSSAAPMSKAEAKTNAAATASGASVTLGAASLGATSQAQQNAAAKRPKAPAAAAASAATADAARVRMLGSTLPGTPASATSTPGEFALRLLSALGEAIPDFVDHFTPALLKLTQGLTREHLLQSSAANGSSSSSSGSANKSSAQGNSSSSGDSTSQSSVDSFGRNRVMATPALAIVDEWHQMLTGRSNLSVNSVVRHAKKREQLRDDKQQPKKKSASAFSGAGDGGLKDSSAIASGAAGGRAGATGKKKALASSSVAGSVSGVASTVVTPKKTSIELLIVCYDLLSKCSFSSVDHRRLYTNLLVHCLESSWNIPLLLQVTRVVGHLIATDPRQLLTAKDKMTMLSKMSAFDRLNEIAAAPLTDEYYALILKLCDPDDAKNAYLHICPSAASTTTNSHFLAGLLAPDPAVRAQFFRYFLASMGAGPVERLEALLRQDWQACGTRYWPVIAIETLLAGVSATAEPMLREPHVRAVSSNGDRTAQLELSGPHATLLERFAHVRSADVVESLRDLAHIDLDLAKELWVNLFRATWSLLEAPAQAQLTASLIKTLASKFSKRDLNVPLSVATWRINSVQTLLQGIVSVSPRAPMLTPELVLHLASAHDVWAPAARLCEYQVENAALSVESRLRWVEALSAIYKQLSEDDLRIGLSLENVAHAESRSALTLEALGCVHEAQEAYYRALATTQSGRVSVDDVTVFELRLWEERWVGCAKQLCQWQLMDDFAKTTQNHELLLDCAWKRGDWAAAKQLLVSPAMQSAADLGCPHTRLQRLYIAILDNEKHATIDVLTAQTAELALHQWQGLPRVLSRTHIPLMHLFHKFVEVKESIQMMGDIKHASQLHTLPNLKPSINTWRERLPNKWEPILLWDDILTWRAHMFQVVKSTFAWSDAQMLASMHDSPWSVVKLAHTARKQHLPDVCLGALAKLYSVPAMDVQDAFSKLREQVSICYESSAEYHGGLSILNNTNLDYFTLRQKAEMFRLKGLFLEALGELSDANQSFSHCLQVCDSYGKGWLSWGHYCYRLFLARKDLAFASQTIACYLQAIHHRCNSARLMVARVLWLLSMDDRHGVLIQAFETHGKQLPIWIWIIWIPQLLMALGRPEAPQIRGLLRGLSAKFPQALYYTMRAFFLENRDNAMATTAEAAARQSSAPPPPSLSGSSAATTSSASLSSGSFAGADAPSSSGDSVLYYRTKSGHAVAVPSSLSVAQLQDVPGLVGPGRPSSAALGVAPSAVLSLESWKAKVADSSSSSSSSSATLKSEVGPVQYTEDLLNFLRRSHDSLTFEMECMLEEMITRFRPEPEEELLTAVHALLLKCYQLPRLTKTERVPKMLRAALARVCRKLFVLLPHQKNEKHVKFVDEFKDAFERDFSPAGDDDSSSSSASAAMMMDVDGEAREVTLYEIMNRLKHWKNLLQLRVKKVGKRNAGKLYLEHCSRHLVELSSSNMEIPGQYISDSEPIKDLHARVLHFESTVDILLRNGFTQRRVAIGGSDGRTYYFLVQYAMTHITRTDERMMQMYLLLNRLLLRHKETRKRNTVFHIPKIIPLTPRVRLLEDNRDFVTLGEIYEQDCMVEDKDPDLPVELYRERVCEAYAAAVHDTTQQEDARIAQAKARAFREICDVHVPETLLSKYVHGISAASDAYFQFRSEFTKHLALSSFLSYALFVGDRAPHRILFSRRTGRVVSTEMRPGYASSGILEAPSSMPFRLTRNLHNFVTRPGVQGPFSIVMAAMAEALVSEEDILSNQLCLFFRDDLLSWHASKTRMAGEALGAAHAPTQSPAQTQRRLEAQIQQRVEANVSLVMERVHGVARKHELESARGKSVRELLEIATSSERQREMYPTWSPWL